jgi:hypothetical protein
MMEVMALLYRAELDSILVSLSNQKFTDGLPEAAEQPRGDGALEVSGGMKEHGQKTSRVITAGDAIRRMTFAGMKARSRNGVRRVDGSAGKANDVGETGECTAGRYNGRQELVGARQGWSSLFEN